MFKFIGSVVQRYIAMRNIQVLETHNSKCPWKTKILFRQLKVKAFKLTLHNFPYLFQDIVRNGKVNNNISTMKSNFPFPILTHCFALSSHKQHCTERFLFVTIFHKTEQL